MPIFKIFKKVLNRSFVKGVNNRALDAAACTALAEFEKAKIMARRASPRDGPNASHRMAQELKKITRNVVRQFTAFIRVCDTSFIAQMHRQGVFDKDLAILELLAAELRARDAAEEPVVQALFTELNSIRIGKIYLF